jgi:hypothetical protein
MDRQLLIGLILLGFGLLIRDEEQFMRRSFEKNGGRRQRENRSYTKTARIDNDNRASTNKER